MSQPAQNSAPAPASPTAPPTGRSLVVLAAPAGGPLAGIREALQDWSAIGLVGEYLWVEPGAGPADRGLLVTDGEVSPTTVEDVLATRRLDRIRLCILVPVVTAAEAASTQPIAPDVIAPDVEDRFAERVTLARGPATVDRLRCIVTRTDAAAGSAQVAREGWHNVVISPEDAAGPGLGMRMLSSTDDAIEIGPPAAAVLAGLTGLWAGIGAAPLDDQAILPGNTVRVARGYYRRLDADTVQQAVRGDVFSMRAGLPRPRTGTGQAATVEDVPAATTAMAQQLWTKHRSVLRGPRVEPPPSSAAKVGPLHAVRMLFGFIWATVRNAPMNWYRTMLNKVASKTASAVQSGVFGREPSAYEVVVRGVRPDGSPADWRELAAASGQLEDAFVESGQLSQPARADLGPLWQDYVGAALTLADAGDRGTQAGLPPITVGTDLGVIRRPADIAPGPDTRLDPDGLVPALHPADVLGSYTVEQRLSGARDLSGDRTLSRLRDWKARWQHSFVGRVGARLGKAVLDTQTEVRTLVEALAQAADLSEIEDETRRRQRKLAKLMRIFLVVFVVLEVILFVLRGLDVIDWSVVAFAGVGVLIAWLIGSFILFVRNQQALFSELNRRREIGSQAEANRQNLAYATRDLRRLTEAYDQFLAWSRVLGVLLAEPFGHDADARDDAASQTDGLPLSVRIGNAETDPAVVAEAVERARRQLFGAGWLTSGRQAPWLRVLADAPSRLGPRAMDLRDDPQRMFAEGSDQESLLLAWADDLERSGIGATGGDWYWSRIADGLNNSELSRQLVARVRVDGTVQDWVDFAANTDAATVAALRDGQQTLSPEIFGAEARVAGRHRIAQHWFTETNRGLSRIAVLIQLTDGLPVFELGLVEDAAGQQQQWQPPSADSVF
ncbi:hypothetical protein [Microlunatus soli]|uniref:Uncharacterized protein n=1 Tax=Microlunatus soli TaxID=630515 RepID=A0A1H1UV91_9ACTN|nr:hypothetical protein [Microlunatus soli]SDS76260.1 hypothetical protein SAMN04489812_2943 [Microlunatus soli]